MGQRLRLGLAIVSVATMVSVTAISQGPNQILVIRGHAGSMPVTQINGRNYVEIEALARVTGGSLAFGASQITLTLPEAGNSGQDAVGTSPAPTTGFSPEFLRAGIEAVSSMREWHTALRSAIENQYPVTQNGLTPYEAQAMTNLRLAQAAATSDADQQAAQLIANLFQKMKQLSDKYVATRAALNYIAPDALKNDPLNQSIIACGRSLGAMAASGHFTDDSVCH